jgi:putative ABC transport system permease protein
MRFERLLLALSMRLRSLFRGATLDRELDDELRDHIEHLIEANQARGLAPDAARREALIAIGGVERRKEECRDSRGTRLVEDLLQDLRYTIRTLRHSPAFTVAAVLTLTLGIGATVAIFTVVNGVLLRPIPFPDPDRLFLLSMLEPGPFIAQPGMPDREFLAFHADNRAFEHVAAYSNGAGNLTGAGDPVVVNVGNVTSEFFDVLGVQPLAGRTFLPDDGKQGGERVTVLGERVWATRFGSDPSIVGKDITLDHQRHVVVGLMPAGFDFPNKAEVWTPKVIRLQSGGNGFSFPIVGRLRQGVAPAEARAEFDTFIRRVSDNPNDLPTGRLIGLIPLKEFLVGGIRHALRVFAGAAIFVLLIACANVANLLLIRASGRQREIAMRAALGASRARLIRQLLTESAAVSLTGGALGVLLARWLVPALLAIAPPKLVPRVEMIHIDGWVLAFALGVSLATGIVFGLAPAMRITRRGPLPPLLAGARVSPAGHDRLRAAFVAAEIALALVLLTGAGLMLKSFVRLRAVDSGFHTANVVSMTVELSGSQYSGPERLKAFHREMLGRLSALPGVVSAGAVNWRPLGTMLMRGDIVAEAVTVPGSLLADKPAVSPGYFGAMGIRLIRGRDFSDRDTESSQGVAIVSRSVAKVLSPSEDPVGMRISLRTRPTAQDWLTVVGVVDDVKQFGPAEASHPAVYQPYSQVRQPFFLSHMTFAVRTAEEPMKSVPAMRAALRAVDRDQPATSITLMDDVIGRATAEPRFQARLLGTFAILAVALALVGTYGVLAYSVAQRTHEIGLRMALGARAAAVLWMVIRRTLILTVTGVAIGTVGAWLTTRLLTTFLFETTPTDPATFVGVALTIFIAALVAGAIPARRATRVDPLIALRHE